MNAVFQRIQRHTGLTGVKAERQPRLLGHN